MHSSSVLASLFVSFVPPLPSHITEWIWERAQRGEITNHSWQLSLVTILTAPENKGGKACGLPFWAIFPHFVPPLLPPGRYVHLVNHSTCIRKHYLYDREIAASLLKPQRTVRWISQRPPNLSHFITMSLLILPHINHKDTFVLGYGFEWPFLSTWKRLVQEEKGMIKFAKLNFYPNLYMQKEETA